jgi:hypothetical protein
MVKIAMGQHNQTEFSWLAPCAFEFFFDLVSPIGPPSIDQDESATGFDKVAIDGNIQDERLRDGYYLHKDRAPFEQDDLAMRLETL